MGRPINKKFIGNTSTAGQQIQATAWLPGANNAKTSYINKQLGYNRYVMTSTDGLNSGIVTLVQGNANLTVGTANITVTPYGATGGNVVASARMGAAVGVPFGRGTGPTTADYGIGNVLSVLGGTNTAPASFNVIGIIADNVALANAGTNYNVGNQIQFGGSGYRSPLVLTVNTTNATGAISTFSVVEGSGLRDENPTADPISGGTTLQGANANVTIGGTGATFNVRWGIANLAVNTAGTFSTLPSNPVTVITAGGGTGANVNVSWVVSNVTVTNGGNNFNEFASVRFSTGTAQALATVNAAGSVTSVSVTNPGAPATTLPTVTIVPGATIQYAESIKNQTVLTWDGNVYDWQMSNVALTSSIQAQIQSS